MSDGFIDLLIYLLPCSLTIWKKHNEKFLVGAHVSLMPEGVRGACVSQITGCDCIVICSILKLD